MANPQHDKLAWIYDLYRIGHAVSTTEPAQVRDNILQHIVTGFQASSGCLALLDDPAGRLSICSVIGLPTSIIGQRIVVGDGVMGQVVAKKEPLILQGDLTEDPKYQADPQRVSKRPKSAICWPLIIDGRAVGALSMNRGEGEAPFAAAELERGRLVINMLTVVLENTRLYEAQQQRLVKLTAREREQRRVRVLMVEGMENLPDTALPDPIVAPGGAEHTNPVQSFYDLLMTRSPTLAEQGWRCEQVVRKLATQMDLPAPVAQDARIAALLHNLGQVALAESEWPSANNNHTAPTGALRGYPTVGARLLEGHALIKSAAPAVACHQELLDGSGYPNGISGDDIPLAARLLKVALDFVQQTAGSDQSDAVPQAVAALDAGRGSQYDPKVLDALTACYLTDDRTAEDEVLDSNTPEPGRLEVTTDTVQPGMVLARNIVSPDGAVWLTKGSVMDERTIRRIRSMELTQHWKASLCVVDSQPAPTV